MIVLPRPVFASKIGSFSPPRPWCIMCKETRGGGGEGAAMNRWRNGLQQAWRRPTDFRLLARTPQKIEPVR